MKEIVPDEKSYLGIELDSKLVGSLQKNFPDLNIVCGNATEAEKLHERSGLGNPDTSFAACHSFRFPPRCVTEFC